MFLFDVSKRQASVQKADFRWKDGEVQRCDSQVPPSEYWLTSDRLRLLKLFSTLAIHVARTCIEPGLGRQLMGVTIGRSIIVR
jgi:hypothetical protein